jgi:hypothetical protein
MGRFRVGEGYASNTYAKGAKPAPTPGAQNIQKQLSRNNIATT